MNKHHTIIKNKSSIALTHTKNNENLCKISTKEWETAFFNRKFGSFNMNRKYFIPECEEDNADSLNSFMAQAYVFGFDLIELHLDISDLLIMPVVENVGYRLVDTRIGFKTYIDKTAISNYPAETGTISFAAIEDLDDILELTSRMVVNNPHFYSRFKNRNYFSIQESKRYFFAWVENHIQDKDTLFAVTKVNDRVVAYFIYKKAGVFKDNTIYKGILTAVSPGFQGHKLHLSMQSFIYQHFEEDTFYLDNTTQLTNKPVISNHITSQKKLDNIALTFFWSRNWFEAQK